MTEFKRLVNPLLEPSWLLGRLLHPKARSRQPHQAKKDDQGANLILILPVIELPTRAIISKMVCLVLLVFASLFPETLALEARS